MIINHNMSALNAHRNMALNNTQTEKSMEKLSSGLRINRAGDATITLVSSNSDTVDNINNYFKTVETSGKKLSDNKLHKLCLLKLINSHHKFLTY